MSHLLIALFVSYLICIQCNLYEPRFAYADLDYYEYKEYVDNGWLDPNHYVQRSMKSDGKEYLDGYELINEKLLTPNIKIGYLPIKEVPVEDYEIDYEK